MAQDYKIINIYIDKNKALYGAPFGPSEKYGKRPMDKLFLLMPGYNDDVPPSIQTYLKARSYQEATQNLGLLVGFYEEGEGFAFTPTDNIAKKGFVMREDQVFELRPNCTRKEMANTLNKALKSVHIGQIEK